MSEVNGSGDINIKGSAQKATLTVNGSGDISAEKLAATNVVATVAGSGDIVCYLPDSWMRELVVVVILNIRKPFSCK